MKISLKRWKQKQHKIYRKYSTNKIKLKFRRRKRDLSGKFALLLTNKSKKCATLLYFLSRDKCKAKWPVRVSPGIRKQTSRKFIVSPKRDKKILRNVEVIVTQKFKRKFLELWKEVNKVVSNEKVTKEVSRPPVLNNVAKVVSTIDAYVEKVGGVIKNVTTTEDAVDTPFSSFIEVATEQRLSWQPPKNPPRTLIKPIKIYSCFKCNYKFSSHKVYEEHIEKFHKEPLSDSDRELVIDDDVQLVLNSDEDEPGTSQRATSRINLIVDRCIEATGFYCMIENCLRRFDTEQLLIAHLRTYHENVKKTFPCDKCEDSYNRESSLEAHRRIAHPVEVIDPPPILNPRKDNEIPTKVYFKNYSVETAFKCRFCSTGFDKRDNLDRHMVNHISKHYSCMYCKEVSHGGLYLKNHLKSVHSNHSEDQPYIEAIKDVEKVAYQRCAFCIFSVKNRFHVEHHMMQEHYEDFDKGESHEDDEPSSPDSLENLLTPETEKMLEDESLLVEITKEKGARIRRPVNDPSFRYRCGRCQKRFSLSRTLRNHACTRVMKADELEIVDEPVNDQQKSSPIPSKSKTSNITPRVNGFFKCTTCPQVFTSKEMLNKHLDTAHSKNKTPTNGFIK